MSEEEKEAIEYFKNDIEKRKQGRNYFVDYQKVMLYEQTILNLIQKQQRKLEKKDKIIDEIYKCFYKIWCKYPGSGMKILKDNGFDNCKCSICETKTTNCIECIKQYFERKVENEYKN